MPCFDCGKGGREGGKGQKDNGGSERKGGKKTKKKCMQILRYTEHFSSLRTGGRGGQLSHPPNGRHPHLFIVATTSIPPNAAHRRSSCVLHSSTTYQVVGGGILFYCMPWNFGPKSVNFVSTGGKTILEYFLLSLSLLASMLAVCLKFATVAKKNPHRVRKCTLKLRLNPCIFFFFFSLSGWSFQECSFFLSILSLSPFKQSSLRNYTQAILSFSSS